MRLPTASSWWRAFDRIKANFRPGGERIFGKGFRYEDEAVDAGRNFVSIRRCLFNDFYRRHGAPQLTQLFCATDMIWAQELNEGPYNARFERPTKLADGADMCRFNFTRADG